MFVSTRRTLSVPAIEWRVPSRESQRDDRECVCVRERKREGGGKEREERGDRERKGGREGRELKGEREKGREGKGRERERGREGGRHVVVVFAHCVWNVASDVHTRKICM